MSMDCFIEGDMLAPHRPQNAILSCHKSIHCRWLWSGPIHLNTSILAMVQPAQCDMPFNVCLVWVQIRSAAFFCLGGQLGGALVKAQLNCLLLFHNIYGLVHPPCQASCLRLWPGFHKYSEPCLFTPAHKLLEVSKRPSRTWGKR